MAQRYWYDHLSAEEAATMLEGTGAEILKADAPLVSMHPSEFRFDDSDDAMSMSMSTDRCMSPDHFREKYGGAKLVVYKRLHAPDDLGALMPDGAFTVRCRVWRTTEEQRRINTLFEENLAALRASQQ